jgi:DNA-binding XRE family transcriptional regulator
MKCPICDGDGGIPTCPTCRKSYRERAALGPSDETTCSAAFRAGLIVARRNAKMTQAELAKATGLQPAAISHFECGQRQPSLANLRKLCLALKTSADFLLCLPNEIAQTRAQKESQ